MLEERTEYVVNSKDPFVDKRGRIDNYDLVFPVSMANIITSRRGDTRANHYHPEQLQQVLIVSGSYVSVSRDLSIPDGQVRERVCRTGDLVVTPPMVAHTMVFLEDTTFVNLVPGNRDHDKFGKHTIPHVLVKPEEVEDYLRRYSGK